MSVRFVMARRAEGAGADVSDLGESGASETGRRRRITGEDLASVGALYAEGLGLEVDLEPGARGEPGASGPGHGPVATAGKVGDAGSVTVELVAWENWAKTSAVR